MSTRYYDSVDRFYYAINEVVFPNQKFLQGTCVIYLD